MLETVIALALSMTAAQAELGGEVQPPNARAEVPVESSARVRCETRRNMANADFQETLRTSYVDTRVLEMEQGAIRFRAWEEKRPMTKEERARYETLARRISEAWTVRRPIVPSRPMFTC